MGDVEEELLAALDELDLLGRRTEPADQTGRPGDDATWIDPFVQGQSALDRLGQKMRRAAAEEMAHGVNDRAADPD